MPDTFSINSWTTCVLISWERTRQLEIPARGNNFRYHPLLSHHPLKTFQPTVNISFLNCTKYNTVTMFSSNAFNGKGDNNGRCFDNLRLMLSSKYNGLTTSYLEASHIPTLPSTIEPSDKVDYVKKNKKLIWLQSSCDSSV